MKNTEETPNRNIIPRPILKWAGGKTQILSELMENCPEEFETYYEPFIGGGAFFFQLFKKGRIGRAVLSDLNTDLVFLYEVVRDNVDELIAELDSAEYENEKSSFYAIRDDFNKAKLRGEKSVSQAARLIYLNRTCFNGLYRVNSRGEFNVPFGRYKNPQILDEKNLSAVSVALSDTKLMNSDFEGAVSGANKNDFVYFDPPYMPVSKIAEFTAYTKTGFDLEEHQRLSKVFHNLDKKGCYVLESNSANDIIRDLYKDYSILEIQAARVISSKGTTRGKIPEFLIMNYGPYKRKNEIQTLLNDF